MAMSEPSQDKTSPVPLTIISLATFLALVVFTVPLTTIEAMTTALDLSSAEQAWIMSGMPLGAACGLLTAGALGDTMGRRRTFVGGLWLTAVASLVAALASSGLVVILMRVVQGLGSAGTMACGLGLLGHAYRGKAGRRAAAVWAAALGGGVAAGPIIASLLIPVGDWAGIHWLILISSAPLALLAGATLPESPRIDARVDLAGSVLLIAGLACLLSALTELRVGDIRMVVGLAILGTVLLLLFLRRTATVSNPLLRLDLFRLTDFTGATLAAFASGAGVLALMSMVPTILVRGTGLTPLAASVVLLGWSGLTMVAALGSGIVPDSMSPRARVIAAIAGCALGQALTFTLSDEAHWAVVLPGLIVAGLSNGILNAALGHEAVRTVPPERSAMGSAANNTARYLGSAVGLTIYSLLIARPGTEALFAGWHLAVVVSVAISGVGIVAMILAARLGIGSPRAANTSH
ncbi:major facilitator superfamily protein [Roseivivax marinus]|uniref:Major facilitator superfamily protein n=2 Tax=Roseivivax marinus TaxID=1379903 RepID=W4HHG0_9RHOB|nr:major facilitator superfamily protein [Roseivivax marinus]